MVNRRDPVLAAAPTKDNMNPKSPESKPLVTDPACSWPITTMARIARRKYSGGWNTLTRDSITGTAARIAIAPSNPPKVVAAADMPSARGASPRRVIA
jgi:hypothetical protein